MNPTIKSILARFRGDIPQAIAYCHKIANTYPELRGEYGYLAYVIARMGQDAAHA